MAQVETAITRKSPTKTPEKAQSLAESLQALPKRKFVISGISSQNIINKDLMEIDPQPASIPNVSSGFTSQRSIKRLSV